MKKAIPFILAAAVVLGGIGFTTIISKSGDASEKKYRIKPKCEDKEIVIEIDGVALSIPRTASVSTEKNSSLSYERRCDVKFIPNVIEAGWPRPEYLRFYKLGTGNTWYSINKKKIDIAERQGKIVVLKDGLKKITFEASELYIFPLNLFPTADNDPVVLNCDEVDQKFPQFNYCSTAYNHPSGFKFSYRFSRKDFSPEQFIQLEKEKRKKINQMIEKARAFKTEE